MNIFFQLSNGRTLGEPTKPGDKCEKGSQLRPHVVWFGEMVPMMEPAVQEAVNADIFIVVGTSLLVYPAAGLLDMVDENIPKYIIDPKLPAVSTRPNLYLYEENAGTGMAKVAEILIKNYVS